MRAKRKSTSIPTREPLDLLVMLLPDAPCHGTWHQWPHPGPPPVSSTHSHPTDFTFIKHPYLGPPTTCSHHRPSTIFHVLPSLENHRKKTLEEYSSSLSWPSETSVPATQASSSSGTLASPLQMYQDSVPVIIRSSSLGDRGSSLRECIPLIGLYDHK